MKLSSIVYWIVIIGSTIPSVNGQIRIGVRGGVNISSVTQTVNSFGGRGLSIYDYYSSDYNYYAGIEGDLVLNSKFKFSMGLDYSRNSYNYFYSISQVQLGPKPISISKSALINFIKMQTVINYGLPLGNGKISIGAGGSLSLPVSGQFLSERICGSPSQGCRNNSYDTSGITYKDPVPGIIGNLEYEFKMGLFVELQYEYMFNVESVNFIPDPLFQGNDVKDKINLNVFKLGVGYYIPKMKKRSK